MTGIELIGALITGGVAVEIVRRAFSPAESRLIDSTAMRSELWHRVETLESDVKSLRDQIEAISNDRDRERDEKRRYRTGYEKCYEYTERQGQAILMANHLRQTNDDAWKFWFERLVVDANSIPNFLPPVESESSPDEGKPTRSDAGSHG